MRNNEFVHVKHLKQSLEYLEFMEMAVIFAFVMIIFIIIPCFYIDKLLAGNAYHWLKKLCIDGRIMDGQYFIQFCLFYKYSTISILIGQYN